MNGDKTFENAILRRLDILIALQLEAISTEEEGASGKIGRLLSAGVAPAEVASIVGKPLNYVTAVNSRRKKRKGSGTRFARDPKR